MNAFHGISWLSIVVGSVPVLLKNVGRKVVHTISFIISNYLAPERERDGNSITKNATLRGIDRKERVTSLEASKIENC